MRIKNWLLALAVLLVCSLSASAQAPYNSVEVSVNVGDPSWATFYFGHAPNGTAGTTALIVQCDFKRAELITDFDVYGGQMTSQFFAVTCTQNVSFVNGQRVFSFAVDCPLLQALAMSGRDYYGNPVNLKLKLGISNVAWSVTGGGRWATDAGSATIAY